MVLVDNLVGAIDGVAQDDRLAHHATVSVDIISGLAISAGRRKFGDDLNGNSASDFPGVIAAHAIGKNHQADITN